MIIHSNNVVFYDSIKPAYLQMEGNKIVSIYTENASVKADVDYKDLIIIPGIIDTHNHGGAGYRYDDATYEGTLNCLMAQACFGVTGIFPTTCNYEQYGMLVDIAKTDNKGAKILGIHSEGPWGARVGEKGVNTGYPSVDLNEAKKMIDKAKGYLKLVGIAPEVDNALEAIDYFVNNGVTVAQYHTNATYEQSLQAIKHGTSVATHLFNVMTGLHHRDIGVAGASLLSDQVDCELICDGLHVSLPMVKLAMKLKPHDRIMLVSDNTAYLGAKPGKYSGAKKDKDSDRAVIYVTKEGFVLSETGRLSGSSKPVIYGINNLVTKLNMDLVDVCRMASTNVARKYGLQNKGEIHSGKDADLVVVDDKFNVVATYVEGRKVYDYKVDSIPFNEEYLKEHYLGE